MSVLESNYKTLRSWFIRSLQQSLQEDKITQEQYEKIRTFFDSCDNTTVAALVVAGSSTFLLVEMQLV